jgi:glycerol-3-phosphate acyltransferase PlsY
MNVLDVSLIIGAYLFGSISSAIVVCKLMGLPDPRTQGSQNPGATNVLRIGGKKAAAITLAGDMLKGLLPVLLARALSVTEPVLAATAGAAFLGHLYPVFFHFKGGKGVATMLGVLVPMCWPAGLLTPTTWLLVAKVVRISSLSALVATGLAPLYVWVFSHSLILTGTTAAMTIILFWRHRANIRKLMEGTEGKMKKGTSNE